MRVKRILKGGKGDEPCVRISKTLCYLLRYNGVLEGIRMDKDSGFASFQDIMALPMLRRYSFDQVLQVARDDVSYSGNKRFEVRVVGAEQVVEVRACYGRRLEPDVFHQDSKVKLLLEISLDFVIKNITMYDIGDIPEEYLLNKVVWRLHQAKRLNNKTLSSVLGPTLTSINLTGCLLTETSLRMLGNYATNLTDLNLSDQAYIVSDRNLGTLLKKLPHLEKLNLTGCTYISSGIIDVLLTHCPKLHTLILNLATDNLTQPVIINFLATAENIAHLDIHDFKCDTDFYTIISEIANQRNITLILKTPQ